MSALLFAIFWCLLAAVVVAAVALFVLAQVADFIDKALGR